MLESVKISRRQSEIRQSLAALVGKSQPTEDETRQMETLDIEYRGNEVRYRASLIAEDTERRDASADLETRDGKQWNDLIRGFEVRQIMLALDERHVLTGPTAEVVSELRSKSGFRGYPLPWACLETRAGETVGGTSVPDPITTRPIIDRIFAASVAVRMGATIIDIGSGATEFPVTSSSVAAGWQATETGSVAGPTQYTTVDKPLKPDYTLGVTAKITRRALKQSGAALEDAVRRDLSGAIGEKLDAAVFLGAGASGEPAGVLVGSYSITSTAISAAASWAAFRGAVKRFLIANAAASPADVRLMIRPEVWDALDNTYITNTAVTELDRLKANISNVILTANGLAAPAGGPPVVSKALLTVSTGGVAPIFVGAWGAIDLIRDPFSDAASGGLRVTALTNLDVTVARPAQLQILTGIQ